MRLLPKDVDALEKAMLDRICNIGDRTPSAEEIHARIRWAFVSGKYCAHLALDSKTQDLSDATEEAFCATFRILEREEKEKP